MELLNFFDANVFIGRHSNPYTPSPFSVENALEVLQSRQGITGMLVYHSAAVAYDPVFGNQLLIKETREVKELKRVWVAVPDFAIEKNRLTIWDAEMHEHNVVAVKIFCHTHNFRIESHSLDVLLEQLEAKSIPLMVDQVEIPWSGLAYILNNFPSLPVVLMGVGYRLIRDVDAFLRRFDNLYLEISRYQVHRGIESFCRRFGSKRLIFGSGLPVFSPEPAMMMVASAAIGREEKMDIAGENLRRLLHHEKD
ncbi:MAG: hypothetical protein D6814_15735 [Calditrichaeota bacterium]|nr:MAG: hypothetical protein D6814_15735 [Calditrichota bacterium]